MEARSANEFLPPRYQLGGAKDRLVSPREISRKLAGVKPVEILTHFKNILGIPAWEHDTSRAQTISQILIKYPLDGFCSNVRKMQTVFQNLKMVVLC